VNWKLILLGASFSVTVWWIIDSTASPKTAEKLHRAAVLDLPKPRGKTRAATCSKLVAAADN